MLALAERIRDFKRRQAEREILIARGVIVPDGKKRRGRPPKLLSEALDTEEEEDEDDDLELLTKDEPTYG